MSGKWPSSRGLLCHADEVLKSLHTALFAVYRHSSEVLHGTLFGALFFMGRTQPMGPQDLKELEDDVCAQVIMLLFAAVSSVSAYLSSFGQCFSLPPLVEWAQVFKGDLFRVPYFDPATWTS